MGDGDAAGRIQATWILIAVMLDWWTGYRQNQLEGTRCNTNRIIFVFLFSERRSKEEPVSATIKVWRWLRIF
jgi:hypothetical protein